MQDRYLGSLEFFKIIDQLALHTSFSASHELALALRPSDDEETVRRRLAESSEAKELLAVHTDVTVGGAHDVRALAERAHLGARLQPSELMDVRSTLTSARAMRYRLLRMTDRLPILAALGDQIEPLSQVIDEIERCLDDDGRVLDSASPALARIRRESEIARDRLLQRLQRIVSSRENEPYLQEPIITERNRRFVIPLKSEFKGRIPGIIQDQSSSGATLFIEPLATVELNNRWHELQLQERDEVDRILAALSALVGQERLAISHNVQMLARVDLALAKGKYSYELKGRPAEIGPTNWPVSKGDQQLAPHEHPLHLIQARHPLLPKDSVVPIDVYLGGNFCVLLITGPNTGGKTVALKTVGLLAAMSQAGLHIPAADGSRLPVFSGIYADIGDEQSIEQSLSTFSSHMTHIIDILHSADQSALVLLDELGAGTDPVEGAALAQSLIHALLEKGCLTASSSHYSPLKVFAFETPGVENGSVEFDLETLSPTYKLVIGLPGRSNAFAIAEKLGLQSEIIEAARALVSSDDVQADVLLASVMAANAAAERAQEETEAGLKKVRERERELGLKLSRIEQARRMVLDEARAQAREELQRMRSELRRLRQSVLSHNEPAEVTKQVAQVLDALEESVAPVRQQVAPPAAPAGEIRVGDTVHVTSLDQSGELVRLTDEEAEVRIGGFRLRTAPGLIEFRSRPRRTRTEQPRQERPLRAESPGIELDLRGLRAEEVAPVLDKYLDSAYLSGLPWVHIIHGKGTGVLKSVVRQQMKGSPLVDTFRPGELSEGGDGVTVGQMHKLND